MKKIVLILIVLICVLNCACVSKKSVTTLEKIKADDVLTVGVKVDSKPFGYLENGEHKGFDVDIAKYIAKDILNDENKVKFVEITSENRISKLITGEIDIIVATMTDTPERRTIVDFSYPYYVSGQAILCKNKSEVSSVADLSNHNIVVVRGSTAEKTLKKYYQRSNVIKKTNYTEAFQAIDNDTCLISDEGILRGFSNNQKGYSLLNKKLSIEPYAVAVRKSDVYLKQRIDYTIKTLEKNGELQKLKEKWVE